MPADTSQSGTGANAGVNGTRSQVESYIDAAGATLTVMATWRSLRVAYLEDGLHVSIDGKV